MMLRAHFHHTCQLASGRIPLLRLNEYSRVIKVDVGTANCMIVSSIIYEQGHCSDSRWFIYFLIIWLAEYFPELLKSTRSTMCLSFRRVGSEQITMGPKEEESLSISGCPVCMYKPATPRNKPGRSGGTALEAVIVRQ